MYTGAGAAPEKSWSPGRRTCCPASDSDPFVLRSRMRFVALTDAHVSSLSDPAWETATGVLLVNVRPIADLKEVTTIN
jgi:hypothetical protein